MNGIRIGVQELYYAVLVVDGTGSTVYNTPIRINGIKEIVIGANPEFKDVAKGISPMKTPSILFDIEVAIDAVGLDLETKAILLGHSIDSNGIINYNSNDKPIKVALGFKTKKSNGKYKFVWLTKGYFFDPDEIIASKEGSVTHQLDTLIGRFGRRISDNNYRMETDEELQSYNVSIGNSWFSSVK